MRRALAGFLSLLLLPSLALADGGTLRLSEQRGPYHIGLFTSPAPLRAGPVDVSVLVQDAATGQALSDAVVEITLTPPEGNGTLQASARRGAATNNLFYAAELDLPAPGTWRIEVEISAPQGVERCACAVQVDEPAPRWQTLWPWIAWPALPIALFGLREFFAWKRLTRPIGSDRGR
jgi:hypothetical protein